VNINKPLVSVIITTKNRAKLLTDAINSVINQTYKNLEIIVVDDASTDDTESIVTDFIKQDRRIIYVKNPFQLGANPSRNRGIKLAKGVFVTGLDDDDMFLENRIELLLKNHDENFAFVTSNNILTKNGASSITNMPNIVTFNDMLSNNIVMNQGLILKKRIFNVGMYDETLPACQDYDLWMRLILKYGNVKVIAEPTQIVRMDSFINRISSPSKRKFKGYFSFYKKYKKYMNEFHRKQHLCRIYSIRNKEVKKHTLAIKILINKILKKGWSDFTIFGAGELYEEFLSYTKDYNFKVNMVIDSNKNSNKIFNPTYALKNRENRFVIASSSFYPQMKKDILELAKKMQKNIEVITI
jgi:glycosyltransferase involved in cell wall biosynthesis